MEEDQLRAEVEFYKKRFENSQKEKDILKQETLVLRKELNSMKDFVKKIVIPKKGVDIKSANHSIDKNDMLAVLEFQRKRIDELEVETQDMRKKYEKILFEKKDDNDTGRPASVALAEQSFSAEASLQKANERLHLLEDKLRESTSGYAREITTLKNKLVENQASDILASRGLSNQGDLMTRSISSSTLRRKDPLLDPIKSEKSSPYTDSPPLKLYSQTFVQQAKPEEEQLSLFNYKKRSISRQKLG